MFTTPILAFANIPFYKISSQPATAASLQVELTIWWASCPHDRWSTGIYFEELTEYRMQTWWDFTHLSKVVGKRREEK